MNTELNQLLDEEHQLQFSQFNNETAWQLGSIIKNNAEQLDAKIAIDITVNGQQLFGYAMQGSTIDNLAWIKRKQNVVHRYQHSSWYMGLYYKNKGKSIEEASFVDSKHYAPFGGSFPLSVRSVGVIGSITVSGLPQYQDHLLLTQSIRQLLELEKDTDLRQ
ncbi:UPF0303 protein [Vibrio sp. MACH09]|uniref:heme-degrading domain-containing protein n=1 Tax=Vibrio sp. MACH09 TaxID=3025122 RepID=UPI00278FBCF6|nr:heme-degrading domain-containing protein [Vibrio sp. MACH09]GLO60664.1 UPF0303 protein [Vibrio sp. MACH09]